jgi:hypothetical protein
MITKIRKNPWPYAVIGYFAAFVCAMASWIVFAMRNDMELVREDYYEQEIRYQSRIDSVTRTSAVRTGVRLHYAPREGALTLALPEACSDPGSAGELHFYRPSAAALDRKVKLDLDRDRKQIIDLTGLKPGFWKVQLSWTHGGVDYYFDQPLVLGQ